MLLVINYEDDIDILYTKPVFQYEKNVTLRIDGLPITFPITLDIGNNNDVGNAVRYSTYNTPFSIPDEYFMGGENVYVWVKAAYSTILVVIPVKRRAVPVNAPQDSGSGDMDYEYDEDDENLILNGNTINFGNDDLDDEDEEEDE